MTRKKGMFIKPFPFLDVGPCYLRSAKTFTDLGDDGDSLFTLFKPACKPNISSFLLFNLQQFNSLPSNHFLRQEKYLLFDNQTNYIS